MLKQALIVVAIILPLVAMAQEGSSVRGGAMADSSSSDVIGAVPVATSASREVVGAPITTSTKETPKPAPPAETSLPVTPPTIQATSVLPPQSRSGSEETLSKLLWLFTVIPGVAFLGLGARLLQKKNRKKESGKENNRDCFNLKKLMEDKFKELVDLKGQLEGKAKEKIREQVREAAKETPAAEILKRIEQAESEYKRFKALFEKCVWETKRKKVILVDAVYCFVVEEGGVFKIFKEMHEMLENFPNKKILLTGADDSEFKKWSLDKMPYEVFTLKHNPEKSDPKYYETMLNFFDLNPEDVVYFEHSPKAVNSAESLGIPTFYYDTNKKDLSELKKFLAERL